MAATWCERVPLDPLRPVEDRPAGDHARRRDDEVDRYVVRGHGDRLAEDLQVVDRGDHGGPGVDGAELGGERELQIAVAAALADAGPLAIDGDAARHDEIDPRQLVGRDRYAEGGGPLDGGRAGQAVAEPSGVEMQEAPGGGQARHRHVDVLALPQGAQSHGPLGCIGVALQTPGRPPLGQRRQPVGGLGRAREVGDAAGEGQRKAAHPTTLQQGPDALAEGLFRGRLASLIHRCPQ
jgi:hypothetical protein